MKTLNLKQMIIGIAIWLFGVTAILVLQSSNNQSIGIVDPQALVAMAAQKMASAYPKGNVPEDKLQQLAERLKSEVQSIAKNKNLILFAKGAVWGGDLTDYTELMLETLKEESL